MKSYDIHERIFKFIVEVIKCTKNIPKSSTNLIILNQVTRSVTSMGANDQEADGALTNKDFIHGFTLVRKEGKETVFWLRLLDTINNPKNTNLDDVIKEGNEIVAIVSTIIKNASMNKKLLKI